jgi:hypothetical protein
MLEQFWIYLVRTMYTPKLIHYFCKAPKSTRRVSYLIDIIMKCATQRSTCGAALFLLWSVLFVFLPSTKGVFAQSPYTCTAVEVLADNCTTGDVCDAGSSCGLDCFDCDPCAAYENNSTACIAASCAWCQLESSTILATAELLVSGAGHCSSTIYKDAKPGVCSALGGSYTASTSTSDSPLDVLYILLGLALVALVLYIRYRQCLACGRAVGCARTHNVPVQQATSPV